jgi:carbon starvation protein
MNDYIDAGLAAIFIAVLLSVLFFGVRACIQALRDTQPSTTEADASTPLGSASA